MNHVDVSVEQDHIEKISKIKNPVVAIEELIWNGLDADATWIKVDCKYNGLGGLESVSVTDNGHGIRLADCSQAFGNLGGSLKVKNRQTPKGRIVHGQLGRGRFRAFGLGRNVVWESRYKDNGCIKQFSITGDRSDLKRFAISDERVDAARSKTGVCVKITDLEKNFGKLGRSSDVADELAQRLALYLRKYPGINISYDGVPVDVSALMDHEQKYEVPYKQPDGVENTAELTVIEWSHAANRAIYLCDMDGFALHEIPPGIHARGFHFTAYLRASVVRQLVDDDSIDLASLDPSVTDLLAQTKKTLREHFRTRESLKARDLVSQWKADRIYPYESTASNPLQQVEQEVFDVVALKVNDYLPSFESTDDSNKRFVFRLLREAVATNPTSVQSILRQVLDLPKEQQDELATMLDRTHLSAIINASKTVVDRLDFLASMDEMIFGKYRDSLRERSQLHRILAEELWIFGEQYNLAVDDQALTRVLQEHVRLLGRDEIIAEEVLDLDGKRAIVDLMLAKSLPQLQRNRFEHLVVELKRPNCTIGQTEIGQIEKYAFKVSSDPRFNRSNTKWTFLLIGRDFDDFAIERCTEKNREFGHIHNKDGLDIHVRQWSSIIEEARWRYVFFKEKLELEVTSNHGLEYLRQKHASRFPDDA